MTYPPTADLFLSQSVINIIWYNRRTVKPFIPMSKNIRRSVFLFLLLTASLFAGCSSTPTTEIAPTTTQVSTPTTTEAPTATPSPSPTPTPLPLNGQQTQYFIDLTVDYYNRYVDAKSRVIYTNKTDAPINELVFIIYPTIFQNAIYVKSIAYGDGTPISVFSWESHRMIIPLETPLQPNEQVEIVHKFELYMPDREGTFGQTGRQLNLSYWFPFIPPRTQDGRWMVNEISIINSQIVGEHLVYEAADFDVTLKFSDRRENMKIAAGVLPEETDGILHYQMPFSRTFTLSISDIYVVTERDVDGFKIHSFAFPTEAASGEAAADIAENAVKLYRELYGPVERDYISIVEADFLHGMEFDGLILLSRGFYMFYNGTPETNLTIITPHEISHQWFFSLVGNDQALEPWLDESLATYSEALYYERYHPELVQWWWDNRVDGMQPSGYVDNTIYLDGGYEAYRNSVYLNGAHFLQDLRDMVGDEAFFSFLKAYLAENKYEIASSEDFWRILSQHTNTDLTQLIEEYFRNPPTLP